MIVLLSALACSEAETASTCTPADAPTVTVDGVEASPTGSFLAQGDAYQVNLSLEDGDLGGARLTLRLQATPAGVTAAQALEDGPFPVDFALGVAEQGAALWYPPAATSSYQATDEAPGVLSVTSFDGSALEACFAFTGAPARGQERVEIADGTLQVGAGR